MAGKSLSDRLEHILFSELKIARHSSGDRPVSASSNVGCARPHLFEDQAAAFGQDDLPHAPIVLVEAAFDQAAVDQTVDEALDADRLDLQQFGELGLGHAFLLEHAHQQALLRRRQPVAACALLQVPPYQARGMVQQEAEAVPLAVGQRHSTGTGAGSFSGVKNTSACMSSRRSPRAKVTSIAASTISGGPAT